MSSSSSSPLLSPVICSTFDSKYSSFNSPPSPTFSLFVDPDSPELWSLTMTDDSDNQSLLSHSSVEVENASIGNIVEEFSEQDFIDALADSANFDFEPKSVGHSAAVVPICQVHQPVANVQSARSFNFELVHVKPSMENAAIPVMPLALPVIGLDKSKKSSKRRSMTDSVGSDDSSPANESNRKKTKREKSSPKSVSESVNVIVSPSARSDNSAPLIDPTSLARVDAGLVTSLLAESQLKKNRLARKAELARLGRKAKNQQIEELELKIEQLNEKLEQMKQNKLNKKSNNNKGDQINNKNPTMSRAMKIKIEANNSLTLTDSINLIEELSVSSNTLIPRFLSWFVNQDNKFYLSSNGRGFFNSLCDKQLKCDQAQKKKIIEIARQCRDSFPLSSASVTNSFESLRASINY